MSHFVTLGTSSTVVTKHGNAPVKFQNEKRQQIEYLITLMGEESLLCVTDLYFFRDERSMNMHYCKFQNELCRITWLSVLSKFFAVPSPSSLATPSVW